MERNEIIEKIKSHDGDVHCRYGLGWKGATWEKTTKENLIDLLNRGNYAHYDFYNKPFGISFYSCSDMM